MAAATWGEGAVLKLNSTARRAGGDDLDDDFDLGPPEAEAAEAPVVKKKKKREEGGDVGKSDGGKPRKVAKVSKAVKTVSF